MVYHYIREADNLYPAWIVDGHYRKPKLRNLKPLFIVIGEKLNGSFLEVIEYYLLDISRAVNFDGLISTKQKLIKADYIVTDGQALSAKELKQLKKEQLGYDS